jgi:carnitine 3-dehydrogenase
MHLFHTMYGDGGIEIATCETLLIHVDLGTRRACAPANHIARRLDEFGTAHANLPKPDGAGRHVGQKIG